MTSVSHSQKSAPVSGRFQIITLSPHASAGATPFFSCVAAAGFPSPAEDYLEQPLDFNALLVENPSATFAVRIAGESMTGAGLFPGDIAIVNRAANPVNGNIILALVDGEFTVKRYRKKGRQIYLQAENPAFADLQIHDETHFEIWGVIAHAIRVF